MNALLQLRGKMPCLPGEDRTCYYEQWDMSQKENRSYAIECSTPPSRESLTCSSAIYRRFTPVPTPDESGNYNRGFIRGS